MALKDGTTSKNILSRGLTSLLDSGKNEAIAAAGAAAAAPAAAAGGAAGAAPIPSAPQRSPSGRLRNSKTPWPWRRERPPKTCCPEAWRPFWILVKTKCCCSCCCCWWCCCCCWWCCWSCSHALKTAPQRSPSGRFRNSKTPWPWRTERPPKTCCPEAWRPFWILVKTKRLSDCSCWACCCCSCCCCWWCCWSCSHAFKTAPQRSPSGRFRNSKTPWPWRTERPPKTYCPEAWRPFWILVKTKRLSDCSCWGLLLLLLLLLLVVLLELLPCPQNSSTAKS